MSSLAFWRRKPLLLLLSVLFLPSIIASDEQLCYFSKFPVCCTTSVLHSSFVIVVNIFRRSHTRSAYRMQPDIVALHLPVMNTCYTCHIVLAFNGLCITNRGTWGYWQQAYYVNVLPSYLDVKNSLHVSVDLPANRTFHMIKHVSWLQISRSYTAFVGWTRANQTWKRCGLRRPMYTHTYQLLHMKVHNTW